VQAGGTEAFEARLAGALPLSDYLIRELASRSDVASVDGRARLVELARPLVRRIPSDVYRELLVAQLAEAVRMPPARLAELLQADAPPPVTQRGDAGAPRQPRPAPVVAGRGNLVRQAISLLVHHPAAGARIPVVEALEGLDRPGVPLLLELLAQLREDPVNSTAALLERWRGRPEYTPLSRLAVGECLVSDAEAAVPEIRSALERLVADHALDRLQVLQEKAGVEALSAEEKAELQGLLRSRVQSVRVPGAKP